MIRAGGGRIVNISSINALTGGLIMPDVPNASYVASKGGLTALTLELAAKWARHGIRVNAIAPGYFPSRLTERIWERVQARMEQQVPLGRSGREDELKRSGSVSSCGGVELYHRADPGGRRRNHAGVKSSACLRLLAGVGWLVCGRIY